jgi:hypothetical protein
LRKTWALLFCDNYAAHCFDEVLSKLARHGIRVMTYPPHTSHIFQVQDVPLFEVLKQVKNITEETIH